MTSHPLWTGVDPDIWGVVWAQIHVYGGSCGSRDIGGGEGGCQRYGG